MDKENPCRYNVNNVLACPMMKRQPDDDYHCLLCGLHVEVDQAVKPIGGGSKEE